MLLSTITKYLYEFCVVHDVKIIKQLKEKQVNSIKKYKQNY